MAKIVKIYKESIPTVKLIGKVYHDDERDSRGTFAEKWQLWFKHNWFDEARTAGKLYDESYVGAMRVDENGGFEYWIGVLVANAKNVPEGFQSVEVTGGEYGVAWIQGKDDGSLYMMHDDCILAFRHEGYTPKNDAWYIERYNCPRFTEPDENGEVILDYLVSIK